MDRHHLDDYEDILLNILLLINLLVALIFVFGILGVRISWFVILCLAFVIALAYRSYGKKPERRPAGKDWVLGAIIAGTVAFHFTLLKYFRVVTWDGAVYLLNALSLMTQEPILNMFYRPYTWPAFLTVGMSYGVKEGITLLTVAMFVASVYLFSLSLTGNRTVSLVSAALSPLVPVVLLWGLSFYSDMYLSMLSTLAFASYFQYNNTKSKIYYVAAVFLFTFAFLTKFTFLLLLIIPGIEFIRNRLHFSTVLPAAFVAVPYLIFQQIKAKSFLYPFTMYYNTFKADIGHNVYPNSYYLTNMDLLFSWVLFFLGIAGLVLLIIRHKGKNMWSLLLGFGLLTAYLLIFSHLKDLRYFIFAVPLVTTSAAYLLWQATEMLSRRARRLRAALPIATVIILGILAINLNSKVVPAYMYSGKDILIEAATYLKDAGARDGEVMSNSHIRLTWYLRKRVLNAASADTLNQSISNANVTYLVNFERSGTPTDFRNTTSLKRYGTLVRNFSDGFETINIIRVSPQAP